MSNFDLSDKCFTIQEVHEWKTYEIHRKVTYWSCRALCMDDFKCKAFIFHTNSTCELSRTIPLKKFGEKGTNGYIKRHCNDRNIILILTKFRLNDKVFLILQFALLIKYQNYT